MTDEAREQLRADIARLVQVVDGSPDAGVVLNDVGGPVAVPLMTVVVVGTLGEVRPLADEKTFALTVLLGEDDTTSANALADDLLDKGHDSAAAVAEKARKDERERIAERLYSESAHVLGRGSDDDGRLEFAASVLSSVADDLVFGVPPTAPTTPTAEDDDVRP